MADTTPFYVEGNGESTSYEFTSAGVAGVEGDSSEPFEGVGEVVVGTESGSDTAEFEGT